MYAYRLRLAALAAVAAAGLAACTTPYGYGGVSVGSGYYGSNYGYGYNAGYPGYAYGYDAGYPGYGYGYAPYWGWYGDYYYPGTGYYVYDRYRRPYRWTDDQRRHWNDRRQRAISTREFRERMEQYAEQQNWSGFDQGPVSQRALRRGGRTTQIDRSERLSRPDRVIREQRSVAREERRVAREERSGSVRRQSSSEFRRSQEERSDRSGGRRGRGNRND